MFHVAPSLPRTLPNAGGGEAALKNFHFFFQYREDEAINIDNGVK